MNKIVHAPQKSTAAKATGHVNNNNEDIVEVQILDLREVCAFVKRCARAAMRTHDNRGKINFMANM